MCGILFVERQARAGEASPLTPQRIEAALARQQWRGPDATRLESLDDGRIWLGHNRLAIIDPAPRAHQPMRSSCGRWRIVFNGEIYNFRELRRRHGLVTHTESDTETLLAGYIALGEAFFEQLEGMFAFVIHDSATGRWLAARDALGIKPLHVWQGAAGSVIASEPAVVAWLAEAGVDPLAVREWQLIRRPVPGRSFFAGVHELLPGTLLRSDGSRRVLWQLARRAERFDQAAFEDLLGRVVHEHELSDVRNVALLSGGIDSALVTALSAVERTYSVGLPGANEFEAARHTAHALGRECLDVRMAEADLPDAWRALVRQRGEPLAVPNEALIHAACAAMRPDEKVVLTGEGADELMFGYDRIFGWALAAPRFEADAFLARYGYRDDVMPTRRLRDALAELAEGKTAIEAVEDFFYTVHLPGLLRRMDFASMAAGKEARVPFADRRLVAQCYRVAAADKLDAHESKKPLRRLLERIGLTGPLTRDKIGFSANAEPGRSRHQEYRAFQALNLEELAWT